MHVTAVKIILITHLHRVQMKLREETEGVSLFEPPVQHKGLQVLMPRRSVATQTNFVSLRVDVGCNTEILEAEVTHKNNPPFSPDVLLSSDEEEDCDESKDYVPSTSEESEEDSKNLPLIVTRELIRNNPMRYIGFDSENLEMVNLLSNKISYRERDQIMTKVDVVFLVLRIRTGIISAIIADLFGISSGYLECLREGITVLADRGFKEIETDLVARGCKLVRPVSVKKNEQLASKDVFDMKAVAALRIHIERVIQRVRLFKFLCMHSCVPLSMVDFLDVVKIACGMINSQERIVKVKDKFKVKDLRY
ncbi:hypothetical protein Pcinc_010998 [Petrolisthes cinctipes]|uniref:DDE Tnp4 domain-containing protein n=1 Tax=Petrolisthes cinctipes TaxID=88211 RepID=A0AAE1G1V6_PETCI|nr:hypothetical protein Pcinc_010998 [Petrolisthes cinctipes]